MDDFARSAHAKAAAVEWYTQRAQEFRDTLADGTPYMSAITDLRYAWVIQVFNVAAIARLLMRAAASEQIPQALRDDG